MKTLLYAANEKDILHRFNNSIVSAFASKNQHYKEVKPFVVEITISKEKEKDDI